MQAERTDAEHIRQLEEKLLQSNFRTSFGAVADLLADHFVEFGSSGRVFNKPQIIASLQQEDGPCQRSLQDFETNLLAPGVILATYRASRQADNGEPAIQSLRSSIWKLIDGRWQMVFHQGDADQVIYLAHAVEPPRTPSFAEISNMSCFLCVFVSLRDAFFVSFYVGSVFSVCSCA